jgi:cytochrome c-type biogenesis protein CcmH
VIAFVSIAAVMLVAALAWVLVPLLRGPRTGGVVREAANVAILRDQLVELDNDVANGVVRREQYDQAKRELEQRVLEESKASAGGARSGVPSSAGAWTAAILGGALPIAAALLYFTLGSHEAFAPAGTTAAGPAGGQHDTSPQKVAEMAANLAAKLQKEPDNAEGWLILAHTYYSLKRFPEAIGAYEHAAQLLPNDADMLADYADALGAANNSLDGKPTELINRALKADPTQWKALALAGTVAFNHKDFKQAVVYWEQLRTTLPPDSDMARSIASSIAEAKDLGGIKTTAAPATAAAPATKSAAASVAPVAASAATSASAASTTAGSAISGTITLSPTFARAAAPEDTVFIVARAAQGPKFPLAIIRKQVKDLPFKFSLDDSMAMSPEMKMSNFADIVVGARVTKSGDATPQSGDLEGASTPVKLGANGIAVVIDRTRP